MAFADCDVVTILPKCRKPLDAAQGHVPGDGCELERQRWKALRQAGQDLVLKPFDVDFNYVDPIDVSVVQVIVKSLNFTRMGDGV